MDLVQQLGMVLGTAGAAFVSTWGLLVRPMQKQMGGVRSGVRDAEVLRDRVLTLEHQVEELREKQGGSQGKIEVLQERNAKFVTSDEFATYSSATTSAVNQLTEKVGRAIGMLEARR